MNSGYFWVVIAAALLAILLIISIAVSVAMIAIYIKAKAKIPAEIEMTDRVRTSQVYKDVLSNAAVFDISKNNAYNSVYI